MIPLLAMNLWPQVPVWTAYVEPSPEAIPIEYGKTVTAIPTGQSLVWYVQTTRFGAFSAKTVPQEPAATLKITGPEVGWKRIELKGRLTKPLEGLILQGVGSLEARVNRYARRGTASVHLGYKEADGSEWVYQEAIARTTPLWTYYCAIGWHRGYFGFQVNSPTERRVIFSVWDAGDEAKDRGKVGNENKVRLIEKGKDVVAGEFGNEGTGGHSHLVYPWREGESMRFLIHAQPKGASTLYSSWFWDQEKWRLMARMLAPKDGSFMKGLYSFDEDFGDPNGQLRRVCDFGPLMFQKPGGSFEMATKARFTVDTLGRQRRDDYGAMLLNGGFRLWTGGFQPKGTSYGTTVEAAPPAGEPVIELPE
ncbi:hypothetical protein BH11ARM2_BH11ARM2_11330 [soil metagenome]